MFDLRSYSLFKEIMNHDQVTKAEVMRKSNLTERQFNYDFEKMNDALASLNLPTVKQDNNIFIIDEALLEVYKSGIALKLNPNQFVFSELDRVYLIYLYTFIRQETVSNYHYQLLVGVSKNTALADVKRVRELCEEWNIQIIYTRAEGYHLSGNELDKRKLALYCINTLLSEDLGKEILLLVLRTWGCENYLVLTQQILDEFLVEKDIDLVKSRKAEMIWNLTFVRIRKKNDSLVFKEFEKRFIERQKLFEFGKSLANQLFTKGGEAESYYVTIQLLIALQEVSIEENPSLVELAERIIEEFERVTLLPIEDKHYLLKSLYNHLVPAFFRISFGIPLVNPMATRIKQDYAYLFQFVKTALAPLSMWTGKKISEDEVGYFTLHFGSYLEKDKKPRNEHLNGLIVCANGISTSLMLKAQLNEMFPMINFTSIHSAEEIANVAKSSYDLIFSTVEVDSTKPAYLLKPLLSQVEKNYLLQAVATDFPRLDYSLISVDKLMGIIKKHAEIKDEEKLFSELVDKLYFKKSNKGRYSPMLSELLTEDMIHFTSESLDWHHAISMAAEPLVNAESVEERYVDAMIKNVEEIGTYIHVGKGIAIPHARPEEGVKEIGMSFLRTKKPVLLLDKEEHAIDVFICIAAVDNESHLKALASLTKILADDTLLREIKEAETSEQIIEIIKKGEN
ncbi:transcription antiterminator BglG [Oceanobacillus zhaokaii]|uniref:Ascorbate-specific PTS system EIIA component n=1 Tax=Oceanobacillus zhaokaii TaxID=2052660 RepID=A0A345PKJ8_9BACI|nr:BglG family transcription antiterminator [Oceanobacillus zhaokaii]AXI10528.1 transcription antiterminator BglG [Oceanobacillus zhaokaii]